MIRWCMNYPLDAALFYTIPDCRKRPAFFLLSFLMSILWTAIFSYIMVWMVTLIGTRGQGLAESSAELKKYLL